MRNSYLLAKEPGRAAQTMARCTLSKFDPAGRKLLAHSRPPPPICRRKSRRILVKKEANNHVEPTMLISQY